MMIDWQTFYEDGAVRDVSGLIRFDPWQQQLAEMVRCVRPGGRVIVALPNHFSRPYRYSYHFLRRHQRFLFKLVSLVGCFEGYLSVLTFVKLAGGDD